MYKIIRTAAEIDEVLNKAAEGEENGTAYFGESYENGIMAFANWLFGTTNDSPFD